MDERMQTMQVMTETAARLLLRHFRQNHPEWVNDRAPLDELVNWLGLQIATFHPADHSQGTYGYMDPDEDEQLIWLRRNLHETVRRFTLAHELGHAVLHCRTNEQVNAVLGDLLTSLNTQQTQHVPELSSEDPCHDTDMQEGTTSLIDQEQFQEKLGIGQNYDPRSQRELAANIFAAELLMPMQRVRTLYLVDQVSPTTLADTFAVSTAAMLNRLAGLLKSSIEREPVEASLVGALPIPAKKQYDEFQQAAIEAPTPALIVAGPGSGKTSTLIGRIEYIVHTLSVQPQHILALTFSRKAAQEMEDRLRQVILGSLPKVSTFHAFCADLLRQHGELVGLRPEFALIDEAEGYFLLRQQANAMNLHHYQKLQAPAYYFPDMLKAISRAKDELVNPELYAQLAQNMKACAIDEEAMQKAEKAAEIAHIYALYQEALQQRGDTDFGGLLMLAIQLLREHPEIIQEQRRQYQQVLVDEFQDVNRASGVLLRELAGEERRVWVVGDANQAIYGFRGASPANISRFESDFPGAVVLPLSRNYRSRPDLVSIAESFRCKQLEFGQEPGKNEPVRLTQPDTYVTLAKAVDEASELHGLVQDIQYKHESGYAYKDMIVLCRTRAQVQKISRVLANAGLPIIERGGILEQEHIKDVISVLLLLTDPGGSGILRLARQSDHPLSQSDIEALLIASREQKTSPNVLIYNAEAPMSMSTQGRRSLLHLSDTMHNLLHAPDIWSLLAQYLLIETTLVRELLCDESTQIADYDALLQLARHYDQQRKIHQPASETNEPTERVTLEDQAKGFLEYLSLLVLLRQDGASRQQKDEDDDQEKADVIRVMTVHASKGLEFPIVYMPGLVQQRFPTTARTSPIPAPTGMLLAENEEGMDAKGNKTHESGESCLFYVGVTRARDHVVLSYSERYGKKSYKRSPYLDALEAGLSEERITKLHWEKQPDSIGTRFLAPVEAQFIAPQSDLSDQTSFNHESRNELHPSVINRAPTPATTRLSEAFINAMKPTTLSASAIEAYQRCPRQYAYSNIYHFTSESDSYQLFWQATQQTVDALRKQVQETHTEPSQQELQELYTQHWQALGGHDAPFAPLYEQHGHEIIESVCRDLMTQNDATWEMRPHYNVDIAGKTVRVTVDRVETGHVNASNTLGKSATSPVFKRTRFGKRKEKPTAETRELLYALAYRQHYPGQQLNLHSHNMSTGETTPITMTPKKEQSLYNDAEQTIQAMERNEYPAQPAEPFRCPTCPFFLICPA